MRKKPKPMTAVQLAYSRGYHAGLKKNRRTGETVIAALNGQVDFWRERYELLRACQVTEIPQSAAAVDPVDGLVDEGPRA